MFRKLYKSANEDIKVDKSLKYSTMKKMLSVGSKKRSSRTLKPVALIAVMAIIFTSLFARNKGKETYAIVEPTYPTKIHYDDIKEKINRRETIDENFLANLREFSMNSSSLVLTQSNKDENSLYSPISLYMALSMVAESANGETQREVLEALNMDSIHVVRNETGKLFRTLYFHNEIGKLSLGNSLWLNKNVNFKEDLLDVLAKDYYASSYKLDFNDKESSREISKWVSKHTGDLLGNDSEDFSLNPDDVLTLINTIYFYDEWTNRFKIENTKEDEFYLEDGSIIKTDFMNMTYAINGFVRGSNYTTSYLELKNNSRMVFVLPDEGVSPYDIVSDSLLLDKAINSLDSDDIKAGVVVFKIPKFNFSSKLNLNEVSRDLGIENAFKETADFTNLSTTKPLFISNVEQESTIAIDENGVEAAAYTEIQFLGAAQPDGRADMILNRPFIFAITGVDGSPLFIGIVNNPSVN